MGAGGDEEINDGLEATDPFFRLELLAAAPKEKILEADVVSGVLKMAPSL